jgi:hypothetical protein
MKKELGIFGLLVVLCIIVSILNPRFLAGANLQNMARLIGAYGIFSVGIGIVIITGGIDLSVGSVFALLGVLLSMMLTEWGWAAAIAVAARVGAGYAETLNQRHEVQERHRHACAAEENGCGEYRDSQTGLNLRFFQRGRGGGRRGLAHSKSKRKKNCQCTAAERQHRVAPSKRVGEIGRQERNSTLADRLTSRCYPNRYARSLREPISDINEYGGEHSAAPERTREKEKRV